MGEHARYSASKIGQLIGCPGSLDFVEYLIKKGVIPPEDTSVYASEGTMLHDQQELLVNGKPFTQDDLNAEQLEALETNLQWFMKVVEEHKIQSFVTETRTNLEGYGIKDSGGTADVIGKAARSLHIFDWKFGVGVYVDVIKNKQLMTYLLGALESFDNLDKYDELWIHLGQPRLNNNVSYMCTIEDLKQLVEDIKKAIKSHDIIPGQVQCLWCRGKVNCSEYNEEMMKKAGTIFSLNDRMQKNELPFKEMADVLKFEVLFKQVFKAIRDRFTELDNEKLADLSLKRVAGRSFRQFTDPAKVLAYVSEHYDFEDAYETPKLRSPSQMEKAIKGIKKDKTFQSLIHKPVGKPTIVDITDKRPDYDTVGAEGVFSHLKA